MSLFGEKIQFEVIQSLIQLYSFKSTVCVHGYILSIFENTNVL